MNLLFVLIFTSTSKNLIIYFIYLYSFFIIIFFIHILFLYLLIIIIYIYFYYVLRLLFIYIKSDVFFLLGISLYSRLIKHQIMTCEPRIWGSFLGSDVTSAPFLMPFPSATRYVRFRTFTSLPLRVGTTWGVKRRSGSDAKGKEPTTHLPFLSPFLVSLPFPSFGPA